MDFINANKIETAIYTLIYFAIFCFVLLWAVGGSGAEAEWVCCKGGGGEELVPVCGEGRA